MSAKDKWVRRFSVDETAKHKNGFTIYKITSVIFLIECPEALTEVSVWKRYSDVQRLHKSMRALHAGLHLRGPFPALQRYSYFKRFQKEVIEDRAKTIKSLLEFIAEHRLLFASTEFVNFLQTGYPAPEPQGGVINAIRSSLHLPIEETPPLEYQTDDDDAASPTPTPTHSTRAVTETPVNPPMSRDETDFISQIPIYEAADVEIRESPKKISVASSFESINSLESIDSDIYDELNKLTVEKKSSVKSKSVLPDLINFDAPSTSKFEDYHTMKNKKSDTDTVSLNSNMCSTSSYDVDSRRSSRVSVYSKSVLSLSNAECKTKTEDSYVFEAGYMLNLAARCEDMGEYQRAFECYKNGIEKMLIGVQSDTDPQRRALIKEKTNKYLSYAEEIYKNHLCDVDQSLLPEREDNPRPLHCPIPLSMLRRPYEELSLYRVLAVLGSSMMLVHRQEQAYYAMKVIQKIPNNLTEFDEYFLRRTNETRQPILPTVIPYMVPLHAYIETNNLIFLILSYAPGEQLVNYIRNYSKSTPTTPAREVNLENVFTEPKNKNVDTTDSSVVVVDNNNIEGDVSVKELVLNSQKLLLDVDKVLTAEKVEESVENKTVDNVCGTPCSNKLPVRGSEALPPSALRKWGAEILTALESLHNCGVICRDLSPANVLLGSRGQATLTYALHYPGAAMRRHGLRRRAPHVAPELLACGDAAPPRACDYWSFGALMYELLCGEPLSAQHRTFTSHTILQLPASLPLEAQSLLTQLLTYDPHERLGSGKDGIEEIKRHPYFKHIDWQYIYDSWTVPD